MQKSLVSCMHMCHCTFVPPPHVALLILACAREQSWACHDQLTSRQSVANSKYGLSNKDSRAENHSWHPRKVGLTLAQCATCIANGMHVVVHATLKAKTKKIKRKSQPITEITPTHTQREKERGRKRLRKLGSAPAENSVRYRMKWKGS